MPVKPTAVVTVASVSPLRVLFPGSSVPVTAKNYGLSVSVGQKVTVNLGPAPQPPIITAALSAAPPDTGGDTLVNLVAGGVAVVTFDLGDVVAANAAGNVFVPTGWSLTSGDPSIYAVPDDGGMTVAFDAYPFGGAAVLEVVLGPTSGFTASGFCMLHGSALGLGWNATSPLFPSPLGDNLEVASSVSISPFSVSESSQTGSGYALPFSAIALTVSGPTVTASGSFDMAVGLFPLVPSSIYVDPA